MRRAAIVALAVVSLAAAPRPTRAQDPGLQDAARGAAAARPRAAGADAGVRVSPGQAMLGERLSYRGFVLVPPGQSVHFERPDSSDAYAWGPLQQGRAALPVLPGGAPRLLDSVWVETQVQLFATGPQRVPGLFVHVQRPGGPERGRLPSAMVTIAPMLSAADTNAQLRPVRGPIGAPWWERVNWVLVAVGVLALALLMTFVVWWRRRRRRPAPVAAPAAAPPVRRRPAIEEALATLAALRVERLPARGEFGEHALRLTRLLRVYLERSVGATAPGDTSSELLDHLRSGAMIPDDLDQLSGLLGIWDRVKFARAPLTEAEAERAEAAVESFLRRHAGVFDGKVA